MKIETMVEQCHGWVVLRWVNERVDGGSYYYSFNFGNDHVHFAPISFMTRLVKE